MSARRSKINPVTSKGDGKSRFGHGRNPGERVQSVLTTNNVVLLSLASSILSDAGIEAIVFDNHMAAMDGSIGAIPRRLMVYDHDVAEALEIIRVLVSEAA